MSNLRKKGFNTVATYQTNGYYSEPNINYFVEEQVKHQLKNTNPHFEFMRAALDYFSKMTVETNSGDQLVYTRESSPYVIEIIEKLNLSPSNILTSEKLVQLGTIISNQVSTKEALFELTDYINFYYKALFNDSVENFYTYAAELHNSSRCVGYGARSPAGNHSFSKNSVLFKQEVAAYVVDEENTIFDLFLWNKWLAALYIVVLAFHFNRDI